MLKHENVVAQWSIDNKISMSFSLCLYMIGFIAFCAIKSSLNCVRSAMYFVVFDAQWTFSFFRHFLGITKIAQIFSSSPIGVLLQNIFTELILTNNKSDRRGQTLKIRVFFLSNFLVIHVSVQHLFHSKYSI